jgi:hypothetical protein
MCSLARAPILILDRRCGANREARPTTRPLATGMDPEEETMANDVIEVAMGDGSFAPSAGGEQAQVSPLAAWYARDIQRRAQEDAAMDAEGILMQAEEAGALDPVG